MRPSNRLEGRNFQRFQYHREADRRKPFGNSHVYSCDSLHRLSGRVVDEPPQLPPTLAGRADLLELAALLGYLDYFGGSSWQIRLAKRICSRLVGVLCDLSGHPREGMVESPPRRAEVEYRLASPRRNCICVCCGLGSSGDSVARRL